MPLTSGSRLGPYEILSPLGAGGMGEVYRAKDARLGRDVVVKTLKSEIAADAERIRRFEQEARAASALNHPNIVTVYDFGSQDGTLYIAMELVEGNSLRGAARVRRAASGPKDPRALELDCRRLVGRRAERSRACFSRDAERLER